MKPPGLVVPVLTFDWLGSVCKVRTQDPENFDEEVKSLVTAWRFSDSCSYDLFIYKFSITGRFLRNKYSCCALEGAPMESHVILPLTGNPSHQSFPERLGLVGER
jgi:hypothetical protein